MSARLLRRVVVSSVIAGLLSLGPCPLVWGANPNSREPMLPLDIHNLTNAQATLQAADGLFNSLLKDIQSISANPARVAGKKVSELHVRIRQLRRAALDLQMLGETAGVDYGYRANALATSFSQIVNAFRSTPAGQTYVTQAQQFLATPKATQARKATVQKLQALMQQKQVDQAYQELNDAYDQLTSLTMLLDTDSERIYTMEFAPVNGPITTARNTAFRTQAQAAMDQMIASLLPKTKELLQNVTAAATALQSAAQASAGGQALAGPQCLDYFGNAWKQLQLSAIRCRAIDWARMTNVPDLAYLQQIDPQQARIREDALTQFNDELLKGLASLIAADAQRASEADVPALYTQYLQVLVPLVGATADDKLSQAVQPALEQLAGKSAAFSAEVKSYHTATHELLRWRERLAQAGPAAASASFPPTDLTVLKAFMSEGQFHGLFIESDSSPNRAILTSSCPQMIPVASQRTLEKPVRVQDVIGLAGGKLGVARYRARHYATLPLPDASAELTRLQQDLLVTSQQPALTLEAAAAVDSAQHGNYVEAGGLVKGIHLEGLIPRFATLRPEAQQLVALGPLPTEIQPLGFISHVVVRMEVAPAWVQHRYFFLPLPNAAPAAPKQP